jgi:hypothetical protein
MTARWYIGAGQGDESEKTYPSAATLRLATPWRGI